MSAIFDHEEWDLLKDGSLWKAVLAGFGEDPELEEVAKKFVARLQQRADRRDPLQFVLMDRRASNYFRQLMLLRFEANQRRLAAASVKEQLRANSPDRELAIASASFPKGDVVDTIVRYQLVLDRQDHYDAALLQRQQALFQQRATIPPRKPAQATTIAHESRKKRHMR